MAADFDAIAAAGFNTVRTYTTPSPAILDEAGRHGLRVMVGLPWPQHIAFLGDLQLARRIRRDAVAAVRRLMSHPAVLMFAVGNEIPPAVVRWHGHRRIERFLNAMYDDIKSAAPESLLTYVNFPPTEYLDLRCFDVCAFNVYLHRELELRAYLARLQHIAGPQPLLLAEAGADSRREGLDGQAVITAMHVRAAFAEGACGAVVYSWTDEWWRGGQMVQGWAFGLVDAQRQAKPALPVARQAFAEAPFAAADAQWPAVSVVVCAYDAADTIDDCLTSLTALTYPGVEIIVVNDGSRDATGAIARRHEGVRVIDTRNGGLSAARNVGLAAARGEIVAYTDADVRVDRDWLRYLVQPLLREDVVGVGGPNVVPHDDPWLAQCVARAPGGPRHVLLDDRLAEHVPGCNMAFRRDALLAIGGFNPVFVRAGDDVDVCWRLQARGLRIGFAPAALVWHHQRRTIEAFWRQQVGYGEAEAVLRAHHPEKFSGGRILWRGRIYSPLPFPADFRQRRINTGVWGTAAFPSVYAGGSHWSFLPHSPVWMVIASTLLIFGGLFPADPSHRAAWVQLAGLAGWLITLAQCVVLALRCDLRGLQHQGLPPAIRRIVYTAAIAWLHVLQPLARMRGRLRGAWSLPQAGAGRASEAGGAGEAVEGLVDLTRPTRPTRPTRLTRPTVRLLLGLMEERAFWSESWLAHSTVLSELATILRASRPAPFVEVDDGWHLDRDLSLAIDRWGWLDVRVLVEEHAGGRCLLRAGVRLRLRLAGALLIIALAALATTGIAAATADRYVVAALLMAVSAGAIARGAWRASRAMTMATRALERVTDSAGLIPLPDRRAESSREPRRWRFVSVRRAVQAALLVALVAYATLGRQSDADDATATGEVSLREPAALDVASTAGGVAVGIAGDLFVADAQRHVIRRLRPRPPAGASWSADDIASGGDPRLGAAIPFDGAADIARAPNGDLYVANPRHNRVMRIVPSTGHIVTIAGSGSAGFSGDGGAAHDASLYGPSALATAANGDLYVADTLNNRVRVIARATGLITTVAGDGRAGDGEAVGDSGPAPSAHLSRPAGLAIAPDGDLYIADTGHHRVRKIDAATGRITTVAGDGVAGSRGDGGPAVRARLAIPIGLALASNGNGLFVYIADWQNNRVRVIHPTGSIATVNEWVPVERPTRIAYHSAGWLYVKDASPDGVTALATTARRAVAGARSVGSRTSGE